MGPWGHVPCGHVPIGQVPCGHVPDASGGTDWTDSVPSGCSWRMALAAVVLGLVGTPSAKPMARKSMGIDRRNARPTNMQQICLLQRAPFPALSKIRLTGGCLSLSGATVSRATGGCFSREPVPNVDERWSTGWPFCKCPSTAVSLFTDRRPLMGRRPVRGSPWGPWAWHWRVLPLRFCHAQEIGTSTLPHETKL